MYALSSTAFIYLFIHSFIHPSIHSFIRSFFHQCSAGLPPVGLSGSGSDTMFPEDSAGVDPLLFPVGSGPPVLLVPPQTQQRIHTDVQDEQSQNCKYMYNDTFTDSY